MSEVSLWNAVIVQAINDLFHGSDAERREFSRIILILEMFVTMQELIRCASDRMCLAEL